MSCQPWSNISVHRDGPSDPLAGGAPPPMPPSPSQEELVFRCDQIQRIAADNTLVLEDILRLRQELAPIEDEIHILINQTIPGILANNEMECRDIIQGGLKLEEEMRALEPIRAEVLHLSSEKMKLQAAREELSAKVESLYRELKQMQSEHKQIPVARAELHDLQVEILRARAAYEYEQRAKVELLEQKRTMERKYFNMKMEVERLQEELEKRGRRPGNFKSYAFGSY
ncbi:hypothetical protein EJB05_21103 [Eragrostis curvula]|uniref:Uncharacterized protein n=1 Tax=Eragrostis curvula TaxID=38414 RepID=A0A5J9V0J8_9POAL|nr:hypothetical protein EJB05_21103 [Eragrostis curvula]